MARPHHTESEQIEARVARQRHVLHFARITQQAPVDTVTRQRAKVPAAKAGAKSIKVRFELHAWSQAQLRMLQNL